VLPEAGGVVPEAGGVVPEAGGVVPVSVLPEVAGAAVLVSAAGAAVLEAGGEAAGAADWSDGCLAQAVRSTAAASALRTTFVFIDGTPVE
jgi:hypothetical protein